MLAIKRKYKEGYRPHVCTISCTFFYINKKDMEKYQRLKMANRNREKDKYVNQLHIHEILAVIDCDRNIPTEKMKQVLCRRIWRVFNIKGSLDNYNANIMNIKTVMSHGRVNYDFDETLH